MLFMVRPDAKSVTLLADILETIEVTADELMDQRFAPEEFDFSGLDGDAVVQARLAALRMFVRQVRDLELTLLTKLEQARVRARTVARSDWRLRPIMSLFTSGTQALADHIASPLGRAAMRFDGGAEVFPFLRSRELLAPMAEHYDGAGELLVTDSFRLLGLIKLRDLLERCEVALNALDAHYDLYDWPTEDASEAEEVVVVLPQVAAPVPLAVDAPTLTPPTSVVEIPLPAVASFDVISETVPATEAIVAATAAVAPEAAQVTNWGGALPTEALSAVAAPEVAKTSEVPNELSNKDAIAIAQAAAEDSLKSLSERLADLRAADPSASESGQPEAAKSDAA